MSNEEKMNEELNALLEEYFPKGHKHRGKAIVIVAQANIEIRKARDEVWESIWKFLNEYNEEDSSAGGQIMFHFVYEKLMDIQESGSGVDKNGE